MSCKCKNNLPLPTSGVVDKYGVKLDRILNKLQNDVSSLKLSQEDQLTFDKIYNTLQQVTLNTMNIDFIKASLQILTAIIKNNGGSVGYITEIDPTISDCVKNITQEDIDSWNNKQDALISNSNIKTINSNSLLGSGDITIHNSDYYLCAITVNNGIVTVVGYFHNGEMINATEWRTALLDYITAPTNDKLFVVIDGGKSRWYYVSSKKDNANGNPVLFVHTSNGYICTLEVKQLRENIIWEYSEQLVNKSDVLIVTMTPNSGEIYTADKSTDDIWQAYYRDKKVVVAIIPESAGAGQYLLSACDPDADQYWFSSFQSNNCNVLSWTADDEYTYLRSDTVFASNNELANKQNTLASGTDIKTINNTSILGSGNITIDTLPAVSQSDNGKILKVVNGVWTAVSA